MSLIHKSIVSKFYYRNELQMLLVNEMHWKSIRIINDQKWIQALHTKSKRYYVERCEIEQT